MKEHLKRFIDEGSSPHMRGLRIMLEYFYAAEQFSHLRRNRIPVVSVFGSARASPNSEPFRRAYEVGQRLYKANFAVVTGASKGVMLAANQGVADAISDKLRKKNPDRSIESIRKSDGYKSDLKNHSLGLRISLPFEEGENPWVGSGATFHYFMVRKFFFASLSHAFIACEGGWGTRDELFEILTLVQTGKAPLMPVVYLSRDASHLRQDLGHAAKEKYIDREDLQLLDIVKKPAQAVQIVRNFYRHFYRLDYIHRKTIRLFLRKAPSARDKRAVKHLWPKFSDALMDYKWRDKALDIVKRPGHSYGAVRRFLRQLNQEW